MARFVSPPLGQPRFFQRGIPDFPVDVAGIEWRAIGVCEDKVRRLASTARLSAASTVGVMMISRFDFGVLTVVSYPATQFRRTRMRPWLKSTQSFFSPCTSQLRIPVWKRIR